MKFKVGDIVTIKNDLEVDDNFVVDEMIEYRGMQATITELCADVYYLDIDDGFWLWSDDCFEEPKSIYYHIGYFDGQNHSKFYGKSIDDTIDCDGVNTFISQNGVYLILPFKMIDYIIPQEEESDNE